MKNSFELTVSDNDSFIEELPGLLGDGDADSGGLAAADNSALRSLVHEWLKLGSDWPRFLESRKKARKDVPFRKGTFYIPVTEPAVLIAEPAEGTTPAETFFLKLILHPNRKRLGGPCRCGCGRYFFRKTGKPKQFVDGHAQRVTALKSTKAKRTKELEERVALAATAIEKYARSVKSERWDIWVQAETGITPRTLSGWVNKGYITAPAEKKGKA